MLVVLVQTPLTVAAVLMAVVVLTVMVLEPYARVRFRKT